MPATTGHTVMISDFAEYYRLAAYLVRYTNRRIGLAMGAMNLTDLRRSRLQRSLDGGILEGVGRLFKNDLKLFVYPATTRTKDLDDRQARGAAVATAALRLSVDRRCIVQLTDINQAYSQHPLHEVLGKIGSLRPAPNGS